ncbi:MAG: hypothetical protein Q8J64_06675 [Thermodesulfovibrionales bacterium]|nr:hypothetical protein [Thermodesulfovibrionales bacterium]
MLSKLLGTVLIITSVVFFAGISAADEFHYNNILIGDRASSMGGAYTGISDDPAGLYYNPAGIMYSTGRNLSASVNAYNSHVKTYKGVIGGYDWERSSSALLPNYFGIIQPLGKMKIGFSYAVPDSALEDQDQSFYNLPSSLGNATTVKMFVINFNNEDNIYNYGPSVAAEIMKDLSAGVTLYVHQRRAQVINNQLVNLSDGRYEWSNIYTETNEWGFKPVLGVMWSPFEKVSLGISAAKTLIIDSETAGQTTYKGINYSLNTVDRIVGISNAKRKYPYELRTGVGYFASERLLLSGDLAFFTSVKDANYGDKNFVINAALGTEYYMSRKWAARAGIFTNMANTNEITAGYTNQEEHINYYGGGMSLSHFTKNTSVTLGGNMSLGSGKAQVIRGSTGIQDVSASSWTMFLSSSYSY